MASLPAVTDNRAEQCFETTVDGQRASAAYRVDGDVITFTHTAVPDAIQHRGIGTALVEAGLAAARAHRQKVDPQCAMFAAYMSRHPETHDLLAPGTELA